MGPGYGLGCGVKFPRVRERDILHALNTIVDNVVTFFPEYYDHYHYLPLFLM